jgi:uncharacterized sulfatase
VAFSATFNRILQYAFVYTKEFSMRMFLNVSSFCCFLLVFGCATSEKTPAEKPNIVFILADDLGWADLPSYGNSFNEAPNIDRLSREGIQFSNAYAACPVCSPTRASIQAGQYPARVGIIDFIPGHWRPYEEVVVPANRSQYLPEAIITIGETLQAAGYATGYFGKWHLGNADAHMPGKQGYDEWRIHRGGVFYGLKSKKAIYPFDEKLTDKERLSEVLTDYSVDFIEKNKEKPFFLFLAHYDVHVQLDADMDLIEKYLNKENPGEYPGNAVYAGMIEHVDRSVGRVLAKLAELGITDNTMVVFFSDNGGLVSRFDKIPLLAKDKLSLYEGSDLQYIASSNHPLRAEKGTVFEGGIREPLIIKWPARIEGGSKSAQIISSVDFYPTFVELAGARLPADQVFDGESFVADLSGGSPNNERAVFWHYPVYHHDVPAGAVRKGDWKLIEFYDDNHIELYNLKDDIGETNNRAEEMTEKASELRALLAAWRKEVGARLPVSNPDFDISRRAEWGTHPYRKKSVLPPIVGTK